MPGEIQSSVGAGVGLIRIQRPEALNALNQSALLELADAAARFDSNPDVRCILIVGTERAFATGMDVAELIEGTAVEFAQRSPLEAIARVAQVSKPVVAAVSGYALGAGCELVLVCDLVVASEEARFGLPQINLGIMPGGGGTQRLARRIGRTQAMDLILTGRLVSGREALALGLVNRLVPHENTETAARSLCRDLCRLPPLALRAAKEAVRASEEAPLREGLAYERQLFALLFATDDQKEGMRAFLEKRPPVFMGR